MNKSKTLFTSYDELPLMLNAETLGRVLGISRSSAYNLMHSRNFPSQRIGAKRIMTQKSKLIEWIEDSQKVSEEEYK